LIMKKIPPTSRNGGWNIEPEGMSRN
jgi:hypothetical protein